jgi:putative transposase
VKEVTRVARESIDLLELLRKRAMDADMDFLREAMGVLVQAIMEAEVVGKTGAGYGERTADRVTQRNGYRLRPWDTRVGTLDLHIPKLREGSYFPSLLEPRRRSERALLCVVQQAYVEGVSTRRVDDLVKALGCEGISKSQVSRICQELDSMVESFLGRPLDGGPYPHLWLDALTQKVREAGRIVNVSVVVATGVNAEGRREVLGMDVGTSEDGAFWLSFLRPLAARGLSGVQLVTSDAHQGLKDAVATVFSGGDVAAMPHPLHDQHADPRPEKGAAGGSHPGAHDLPAALAWGSARPAQEGGSPARGAVLRCSHDAGGGRP